MSRRSNYVPNSQKLFVMFSLLFVIAVTVIVISNSRFETVPPDVTSTEASREESHEQSENNVTSAPDTDMSETNTSSEPSVEEPSREESSKETPSKAESSKEEPSKEDPSKEEPPETSWVYIYNDLPYDPSKYLTLRKDDLEPSELDKYFENSLFIGNSLVVHFSNFYYTVKANDKNFLGNPKFLCSSAFSAKLDLSDHEANRKYYPRYNGELVHTWEAVAQIKPETIYYNLMGLNELGLHQYSKTAELTFENNRLVLEKLMAACPGVKIVVLSNTYMIESFNTSDKGLNNYNISKFNNLALEWCNQNGHDFIDISSPYLSGNNMNEKYCSDPTGCGCHIKLDYYPAWAAILRNYACQKINGTWKNIDKMKILDVAK